MGARFCDRCGGLLVVEEGAADAVSAARGADAGTGARTERHTAAGRDTHAAGAGAGRDSPAADGHGGGAAHDRCRAARRFEPPRYCARCGRRMVVQVSPDGWTARCAEHGTTSHTG